MRLPVMLPSGKKRSCPVTGLIVMGCVAGWMFFLRQAEVFQLLFVETEVVAVFVEQGDLDLLRHFGPPPPGPLEIPLKEEHDVRIASGRLELLAHRSPDE